MVTGEATEGVEDEAIHHSRPYPSPRVSTDSAGSPNGAEASKLLLMPLEEFQSLPDIVKLDKLFICMNKMALTNERLLKAEQALYATQNTAEVNTQRIDLLAYKSIDSESRQRRNNLIFWGIAESLNEDSSVALSEFLSEHLGLDTDHIFVQRAHRIGKFKRQRPGQPLKQRPLIACFRDYPDVELILANANKLQGTQYGINRDYPHEIVNARKSLLEEKKRLKTQNPNASISIQYPAKLVHKGQVPAVVNRYSGVTFKTYLGMGSPQKYHIKWYMPKCLSYPEVSEITRLKCPILVRAEKSKMASKMAALKNY